MDGPKNPDWSIIAALLAQKRRPALNDPTLSPLVRALMSAGQERRQSTNPFVRRNALNQPPTSALGSLFSTPPSPQQTSGLFGSAPPPPPRGLFGLAAYAAAKAKQRSTFYSFHYDDVFRVNHIRKCGVFRPNDRQRLQTPQDRSLWEKARNTNPTALKGMVARGLAGTTVTCVLAGEHTWSRPWVRFEIARSLYKGNGLLTVHIDGCECPNKGFGRRGPNPLSFLALGLNRRIYELNGRGQWVLYDKLSQRVETWPKWLARPSPGHVMPLDTGTREYDWIHDQGRENLVRWTDAAAAAAGR